MLVPRTRTELGRRSFSVAAPTIWNSLPAHLRLTLISRRQFRDGFKSHLFADAYFWSSENIRYKSVMYLLNYVGCVCDVLGWVGAAGACSQGCAAVVEWKRVIATTDCPATTRPRTSCHCSLILNLCCTFPHILAVIILFFFRCSPVVKVSRNAPDSGPENLSLKHSGCKIIIIIITVSVCLCLCVLSSALFLFSS